MISQTSCFLSEVACTWSCGRDRIINSTLTIIQHIMNYISRDFIQLTHMLVRKDSSSSDVPALFHNYFQTLVVLHAPFLHPFSVLLKGVLGRNCPRSSSSRPRFREVQSEYATHFIQMSQKCSYHGTRCCFMFLSGSSMMSIFLVIIALLNKPLHS